MKRIDGEAVRFVLQQGGNRGDSFMGTVFDGLGFRLIIERRFLRCGMIVTSHGHIFPFSDGNGCFIGQVVLGSWNVNFNPNAQ